MKPRIVSTAIFWLLCTSLAAQYTGEPPRLVVPPAPDPSFSAAALGNGITEVAQLRLVFHASLPTGTQYACFTVKRTGGAGGWDVMTGTFDRVTKTFVKNSDVDALNTAGDEFSATVSDDLLVFAADTPSSARFATREFAQGPFGPLQPILGVPSGYVDTNFCRIDGRLCLLFTNGTNIDVGDFDPATGSVTKVRRIVTNPLGAGSHSPSPVNDELNNTRALIFSAQVPGRASNAWFTSALDDSAPKFEMLDTPTWLANPNATGGTMTYAEATTSYTTPRSFGVVAMAAARLPSHPTAFELCAFGPTGGGPYFGLIAMGFLGTGGLELGPGFEGKLSLDPGTLLFTPVQLLDPITGTLSYRCQTPELKPGTAVYAQPIVVDQVNGRVYLGNTACLMVFGSDEARGQDFTFEVDVPGLSHAMTITKTSEPYQPRSLAEEFRLVGPTTNVDVTLTYVSGSQTLTLPPVPLVIDNVTRTATKGGVPVANLASVFSFTGFPPPTQPKGRVRFLADEPIGVLLVAAVVVAKEKKWHTDKGNEVEVVKKADVDPGKPAELGAFVFHFQEGNLAAPVRAPDLQDGPAAGAKYRKANGTRRYNCHAMTFSGGGAYDGVGWINDPSVILADNYTKIDTTKQAIKKDDVIVFRSKVKFKPPGGAEFPAGAIQHSETILVIGGGGAVDSSVGKHGTLGVFQRPPLIAGAGLNIYYDGTPPAFVYDDAGVKPGITYRSVAMSQEIYRRNTDAKGGAQTNTLIEK